MLVGVSMSACVGSLLRGSRTLVEGEPYVIITSTMFQSPQQAIEAYGGRDWASDPRAYPLLMKLWPHIVQPRLIYPDYYHSACGDPWFEPSSPNPSAIVQELIALSKSHGYNLAYQCLPYEDFRAPVEGLIYRALQA